MICTDTLEPPRNRSVTGMLFCFGSRTHLVKSKPPSSSISSSTTVAVSCVSPRTGDRLGLATGDLLPLSSATGGGLLLVGSGSGSGSFNEGLDGLMSKGIDFRGVLPMSAYFQKGAGELVGMCWLGRWAVLGGAKRGCKRCGAGVMSDAFSSLRYEDVKVGGDRGSVSGGNEAVGLRALRGRGNGLPSWKLAGPGWYREVRSGVICDVRRIAELGWGDPTVGDAAFRFRADPVARDEAMSLGPCVI